MQIDLFGQLAFGENLMLDIIAACRGAARSSIKLETYYKGNEREKAEWADKYKHNIVARLMVLHCNDKSIRDKTDEAIRLGSGRYPTTIQAASALLTATAKQKKQQNNCNKRNRYRRTGNKKNRVDGSKSD